MSSLLASARDGLYSVAASIHAQPTPPPSNTNPGISPNTTGLPGLSAVREIIGAVTFWGLIACVAGMAISGGALAFAKVTSRGGLADQSKTGLIWAAAGAFVIGASNAIIRFFADRGTEV